MKIIILKNEIEFRNYMINNYEDIINKIIICEDILDKTIFFYCFKSNNEVIISKEYNKNIDYYKNIYLKMSNKLNLIHKIDYKNKELKLIKKE